MLKFALQVQQQMPRAFKRHLGERIMAHCTVMLDLMAQANASRGTERAQYIQELLRRVHATQVLIRAGFELELISPRLWAASIELLENIGRQGGGWLKSAKAPVA